MSEAAFFAIATVTLLAAIAALEAREIVYGALSLALMFLGIAGIYVLLDAAYLAMFQIGVYIGAVVVLILFTVILVKKEELALEEREGGGTIRYFVALVVALLAGSVGGLLGIGHFQPAGRYPYSVRDVGLILLEGYGFGLVVLALVLASALIGALTLAKRERD